MRVLALDTTGRAGSVALVEHGRIVDERSGDASRTHAERLPGELVALIEAHGLELGSFDLFAVAAGPGSFTGLRIGIATMQGLAFVTGRRMVAVSALEALGHVASRGLPAGASVAAWIDAQRGDIFGALYRVGQAPLFSPDRLVELAPPAVADPAAILADWSRHHQIESATFVGDGAVRYRAVITARDGSAHVMPPPLLAGAVGGIAAVRAGLGQAVHPAAIHPLYVRRPDAELDREKKSAFQQ
jgi:tRNA threonylcarbamoyladenosine biosynthesis protein TsaB